MTSEEELSTNEESFSNEDEDFQDYQTKNNKTKNNNNNKRSLFIDEEAIVDDEEDEEEEDLDYEEGFIQDDNEEIIQDNNNKEIGRTNYLKGTKKTEKEYYYEEDEETIANRYKQKYGKTNNNKINREYLKNTKKFKEKVPQSFLLPKPGGTQLFSIKCKPGKETEVLMILLNRCMQAKHNKIEVEVLSCFAKTNMKGYIYVEANEEDDVKKWINKIPDVFKSNPQTIPYNEMTDLINMGTQTTTNIRKGDYVRIKRGKYSGDLGKVLDISVQHDSIRIKLVPRIDFEKNSNNKRNSSSRDRAKQKLFNRREIELSDALRGTVSFSRGYYIFNNETYTKDGFLEKDFSFSYITNENVNPLEEELLMFPREKRQDNINEEFNDNDQNEENHAIVNSDLEVKTKVIVTKGESKGLIGVIAGIEGNTAKIRPTSANNSSLSVLKFGLSQLAKHYEVGDHVKVIRGQSTGKSGMVVKAEGEDLILISDADYTEINVKSNDVKDESFSQVINSVHQFKLHDMVRLSNNNNEVGVTVYCGNDIIRVLDQRGVVQEYPPQMLSSYGENKQSGVSLDKNNAPLKIEDFVKPINKKNIVGQIKYIHKTAVFYKVQETIDPTGIMVSPARLLIKISANNNDKSHKSNNNSRRFNRKRDHLTNKQVLIKHGLYKNYYGFVKNVDQENATVVVDGPGTYAYIKKIHLTPVDPKTLQPVYSPSSYAQDSSYSNASDYKRQKANYSNRNDSWADSKVKDSADDCWGASVNNNTNDSRGTSNNNQEDQNDWGVSNNDDSTLSKQDNNDGWGTAKQQSKDNNWDVSNQESSHDNWSTSKKDEENDWGVSKEESNQNSWGASKEESNKPNLASTNKNNNTMNTNTNNWNNSADNWQNEGVHKGDGNWDPPKNNNEWSLDKEKTKIDSVNSWIDNNTEDKDSKNAWNDNSTTKNDDEGGW